MQNKELVYIIQGNYGNGWEDVSFYPCGIRRKKEKEQLESVKHDLKEYNLSGFGPHRVIKRYESIVE